MSAVDRVSFPDVEATYTVRALVCSKAALGKPKGNGFHAILLVLSAMIVATSLLIWSGASWAVDSVSFQKSLLQNETSDRPTSLQFGPDGRLYVAQQDGSIKVYTVARNGTNSYAVTATQTITSVKLMPNYNDDGTPDSVNRQKRQVTGLVVTGTASNPVIYVSSSDPRIGAGANGTGDLNLDTNSGIISRLTWNGTQWNKVDLVRGLPRSEENHSPNGMQLDEATNTLYLAEGGNTNHGAPSNNFALLPEYALSGAILSIDLDAIGTPPYDLPTLDDEDRPGNPDANDPFGGNDGKNQAKLVPGGPVQVHAPGFRNPYDVLIAKSGRMYTVDNSGNAGWGDVPVNEGLGGACTNAANEPGTTDTDTLHLVSGLGYYGGHPNPTRANTNNKFNASIPQSPVATANPIECDYRAPGVEKGDLTSFNESVNGITEYTASNFAGAMQGDLLAAGYNDNDIYRVTLNGAGDAVVSKEVLFSTVGIHPLDVTAQDDGGQFPGTVWVADVANSNIIAFEPSDGGGATCTGADDPTLDEDGDGFDNADEIDNGTNPCSAADLPSDSDGDKISDFTDPNDDNDSLADTSDPFAIDKDNGKTTSLPVSYTWDNDAPDPGGLLSLGFTGLMTNKSSDYRNLYDAANMTAGGAAGAATIDKVPSGDANGTANTQKYGFQFGVNATASTGKFTAHTRILAPFAGMTPQDAQSMGLFIGNGDQDNYVKLVANANGGTGGIKFAKEVGGAITGRPTAPVSMPGPNAVDLYLTVDPAANTVQPSYTVTSGGVTGPRNNVGAPMTIPAGWFGGTTGLAVGIISTSAGPGPEFPATWDFIEVTPDVSANPPGQWQTLAPNSQKRQEVAYVQTGGKFYLAGGNTVHERYDPVKNSWERVEPLPTKLDHIQGVELGGKIYYIGGLAAWPSPDVGTVYVYDPATDTFTEGAPMPQGRSRGAGGVAVHDGKIYYAGGLHDGKAVAWFDVYNPATNTWTQLPNMPRVRDHFHAAVVDGKFYAIGGRDSVVSAMTTKVDVYDLASGGAGAWQTPNTDLPTPRGGFATAVIGKEILVIGGEGGGKAHTEVEAYDTINNSWRMMKPMPTARHGIQAAVCNGGVYIAAGGLTQGAFAPTNVHEAFFLNGPTTCASSPGDTLSPVVKPPSQSLVTGPALGTEEVPVKISWSGTDSGSGVAQYELQQSINGGPYASVSLPSATAVTKTLSLEPGKTYRFQVRAQDQAGNWSGWKQGPSFTVTVFQESDSAIGYVGAWNTQSLSSAYGGSLRYASTGGNSAQLTFSSGSNVAWVASKGKDHGLAEVWLDGAKVKTVDLYSSTAQWRKAVYAKSQLNTLASHTIEVRALGTKNASSSGTRVAVDAFVVLSLP